MTQESQSKDRDGNDEFGGVGKKGEEDEDGRKEGTNYGTFQARVCLIPNSTEHLSMLLDAIDTCRGMETVCMHGINHISHVGHAVYAYRNLQSITALLNAHAS